MDETAKREKLRDKIIGGVAGSLCVAVAYFFLDYNTTDPEVLPTLDIQQQRLDTQKEQMAIQQQSLEELEQGTDAISRYVVQQEIKSLTELIRMFESRRGEWSEADREQYDRLQEALRSAYKTQQALDEPGQ